MAKKRSKSSPPRRDPSHRQTGTPLKSIGATNLRIIGGDLGGRIVRYNGDRNTRPMKDSVRENLFNVLGKGAVSGAVAWDVFAGTGILAMESLSRGALRAVCIEWNRPMALTIQQAAEKLQITDRLRTLTGDAFRLLPQCMQRESEPNPWIVFFCPPYVFWDDPQRSKQLFDLIRWVADHSPAGSVLVTETDAHWDMAQLPLNPWDVRRYGATQLGFYEPVPSCGATDLRES